MTSDNTDIAATAQPPLTLREQQRAVTRNRIVSALAELIESNHPLDVTMSAVARRAGVSEPTLYRHFENKRTLFNALGTELYQKTTSGVALTSLDDLVGFLPALYEQFLGHEATVRWNLAAPSDEIVRPSASERTPLLRQALGEVIDDLPPDEAEHMIRVAMLMTSATAILYWKDYLGITMHEAAETAAWMMQRLADR